MATPNPEPAKAATERESAPAPVQYVLPRQKQVERQGAISAPYVHRHPQIRGGICEFCGVIDPNQPSEYQYKLCPHYRGMQMACSYCPEAKDQNEVIGHSTLNVAEHPQNPNMLIIWCNSYECVKRHGERFKVGV